MPETYEYVAKSNRIKLRKIVLDDFGFLFELFNNQSAMQFYPELRNEQQTLAWIQMNLDSYKKNNYGKWIIETLDSGQRVGHTGLILTDIDGIQEIELGYFLHPQYWRLGYATEAAQLALELGFNLGHSKIISAINPENKPSMKVAERLGMTKEKNGKATVGTYSWICDVYSVYQADSQR